MLSTAGSIRTEISGRHSAGIKLMLDTITRMKLPGRVKQDSPCDHGQPWEEKLSRDGGYETRNEKGCK